MADDASSKSFSLKRWSQRKLEAARPANPVESAPLPPSPPVPGEPSATALAPQTTREHPRSVPDAEAPALPPIESLTIDSDFTAFLSPKVDETTRRKALRQLFRDPRFNVMDGLDIYIDDYSKPDPIAPEVIRGMVQSRYIFDPPKTRVTKEGYVEDVPPEEADAAAREADAAAKEADAVVEHDAPAEVEQIEVRQLDEIAVPQLEQIAAPQLDEIAAPQLEQIAVPRLEHVAAPEAECLASPPIPASAGAEGDARRESRAASPPSGDQTADKGLSERRALRSESSGSST